jgi:hypothetical protein
VLQKTVVRASLLLLAGAGTLMAFGPHAGVHAQPPHHTRARFVFSSVGIVEGQTLRVTVSSGRFLPPSPVADRVRIRLINGSGQVVADSEERPLPAVQSVSFDVRWDEVGGDPDPGTGRRQLRALVVVSNPNGLPPSPIRAGAEVFSTGDFSFSGQTQLYISQPTMELLP